MQMFLVSLPGIHAETPFNIFESIDRRNNMNAVTAHAQFKAVHIYLKNMQNMESQPNSLQNIDMMAKCKCLCFCKQARVICSA